MTTRTWIGGGNNQASNAKDWSPNGAPQSSETLLVSNGTINVNGNDLAGDPVRSLRTALTVAKPILNLINSTLTVQSRLTPIAPRPSMR
jgi:hypothetical protein